MECYTYLISWNVGIFLLKRVITIENTILSLITEFNMNFWRILFRSNLEQNDILHSEFDRSLFKL